MSITVANTAPGVILLTGAIAVAERLWTGEWSWSWIGWFWGGYLVLALLLFAGVWTWAGIQYLRNRGDPK